MKESIEFHGEDGTTLRGWIRRPDGASNPPVVILVNGAGFPKEWGFPALADVLAEAGIASIAYDHRGFGESDGEPRFEVDPQLQIRDVRSAITFAETLGTVDPARIGIFGASLGGGHVLVVGALDRRVKCVVSEVPLVSGWHLALRRYSTDGLAEMRERWDEDRRRRFAGEPPEIVPHAVLDPDDSVSGRSVNRVAFFRSLTEEEREPWENKVTLRTSELTMEYEPWPYVPRIGPTPLLMIIAEDDRATGTQLSLEVYNSALEPKRVVITRGGHYEVYRDEFERSATATREWFVQWLMP